MSDDSDRPVQTFHSQTMQIHLFSPSRGRGFVRRCLCFRELMAHGRVQIQRVYFLQFTNAAQRGFAEGGFAVKGMQHDAFEQISESHVFQFSEGLQHFEGAFFDADPGLHTLDG